MSYGKHRWSYISISIGLGITFLLTGVDVIRHPNNWFNLGSQHAFIAIVLGALLILRIWPKLTTCLSMLSLGYMLAKNGIIAHNIANIALFTCAFSLFVWPKRHYRHRAD